jgi:ABC-type proline/glycine betaine transport system permease subunit
VVSNRVASTGKDKADYSSAAVAAGRARHRLQLRPGMRQALSIGIILMVISEMFAASSGLGFTIVQFQRGFAIPEMWSGILLLALLGVALSLAFRVFENRVLSWYYGLRRAQRGPS